jgi:hypothetical protein
MTKRDGHPLVNLPVPSNCELRVDSGFAGRAYAAYGGNEFVLAEAAMAGTGERTAAGAPSTGATPRATGTTGTSAMAFELTGPNEGKVAQFVGRRVEITGQLKPAEVSGTGPTGGPTAGAPPRGVDVVSKDLQLRELEITSVREASGTCAATSASQSLRTTGHAATSSRAR